MKNTNYIGIENTKAEMIALKMNELLANYQIFYTNLRGFHWNIKGQKFFELHLKFEEQYDNVILKIDEIAERILTLGGTPANAFSEYIKLSEIKEVTFESDGNKSVESILKSYQIIIEKQRALLNLASEAEDEGTNALMSDYIREQEKLVWMFRAYLS